MAKKILFINQEIVPYVPDSPLALLGKGMPASALDASHEIRTFMPEWGSINERRGQLHEVQRLSGMNLIIDDTDHPLIIKVATIVGTRIQVYFIDNDEYFSRRQMTLDADGSFFADNGERAVFFARGVLETVKKLRWVPDVIHVQGWMGAVVPLYIKTAYHDEPSFATTKVVTSLFNDSFTEMLSDNFKASVEFRDANKKELSKYPDTFNYVELMHMAIDYSDGIVVAEQGASKSLVSYAQDKDIPILPFMEEGLAEAAIDFYEKL